NGTLYLSNFPTSSRRGAVTEFHPGQTEPFLTIIDDSWEPWGLTVDSKGRLFVSDSQNSQQSIIEFPPGSSSPSKKTITEGLILPAGIAHWPAVLP
ncbi:MAG: hypothetical protein WA742_12180, partial [Candidatus Cybelea sp.]